MRLTPCLTLCLLPRKDTEGGEPSVFDDAISLWKLDEASGTRVDSIGSNDLTDNNTVGSAAKGVGAPANLPDTVASFVGANSEYLSHADGPSELELLAGDFSVSMWVKPTGHATTQVFMAKDYNVVRGYAFYYNTSQQVVVQMGAVGTLISTDTLTDGAWNHIAIDYDIDTLVVGVTINGGTRKTTTIASAPPVNDAEFDLGREAFPGFPFYLTGDKSSVAIWPRVLTDDERTELWNSGDGAPLP